MAGRGMSAAMLAEIARAEVRLAHLVEIHLDSNLGRYTDAHRDLVWGGNIYLADGNLMDIPTVTEEADLRVGSVTVSLTGVAQANIATALLEPSTDRQVVIRTGCLDAADALIADPVVVFDGRIDGWSIREDPEGGTSVVEWTVASHWADFEKTAGRRTNHEDQQTFFPGDDGFKFAPEIIRDIRWGRA
ncbi:MAG: hypothetical protein ACE5FN_12010 [Leptospirillia bacterium]